MKSSHFCSVVKQPLFKAIFASAICFFCALTSANAQDWVIAPSVTLSAMYDDNSRLNVTDAAQDELSGGDLDARVRIARRSPTGSVVLIPRVRAEFFPDDPEDESDDYFLNFNGTHKAQKSTWAFRARYSAQQVRTAEIEDPDFDNPDVDRPITDDSGVIQIENRRNRLSLSPGAEFQISPRTRVGIVVDHTDADYDNNDAGLQDYQNSAVSVNLTRQLTQQNAVSLQLFGSSYEPETGDSTSDSLGLTLQFARQLSERYSTQVFAGFQQVTTDSINAGQPSSITDDVPLGGVSLMREFQTSRLVLDLRHSVDPSGRGLVTERTHFRASFRHQFTPLLTGSISGRYVQENTVPDSPFRPDRDFAALQLDASWRLNRNWTLLAAYVYTRQEFTIQSDSASSNRVRLGIRYAPPSR
jgi:opacity protein-like surface antigen